MLLTTLSGAAWLADPDHYEGQPGDAFISVIRVRVTGTEEPGDESQSRLKAVAAAIQERTGLQVDIVKGASTRTIGVDLPAGSFGRPAMTVSEQWSVKGVAVTFLRAVSTQDGALLGLLLVAAGLLVGQGSYIAVRQRRFELARLRALGWSPLRLAGLIEVESLILGLVAGILASVIALPLAARLGVPLTLALVAPAAGAVVATLAALPAAWASSRGSALSAMNDHQPVRDERPTWTTFGLAVRELRRSWAVETLLGILAVAIGAGLVGLVALVSAAFSAQLDTTVLGTALSTEIRPFHVVLAIVTLALGTAAVAQVALSAWLGRRRQLGMLKALGWSGRRLAGLVWWQSMIIGVGGGGVAILVVVASGAILGAPPASVATAVAAALGACLAATIGAGIAPALMALTTPARHLLTA
jgi:ABC-type antimicrobial peptide transport system permease subunit